MTTFDWNQWLKKHQTFSCLDVGSRKQLLDPQVSQQLNYIAGSIVIAQGDTSSDIYLIAAGRASVCLPGMAGNNIPITYLDAGDFFGEIATIEHKTRTATIIADQDLTVLKINGNAFLDILKMNSELEFRILMVISQRLRTMTQQFAANVKELDEKFALFGHQLDSTITKVEANQSASEKKVEAQLDATKVMFEETKKSAHHIIEDAQRNRNRIAAIGSFLGTVIAVVLGLAGFFGIKEFKSASALLSETKTKAELLEADIKESITEFNEKKLKIENISDESIQIISNLKAQEDTIFATISGVMVGEGGSSSNFFGKNILKYHVTKEIPHLAKQIFRTIYQSDSDESFKVLFKIIEKDLSRFGCSMKDGNYREPYIALFEDTLDNDHTINKTKEALVYYYLLSALKLNDDNNYAKIKAKFIKQFSQKFSSFNLSDYQPHWITVYSPGECKNERRQIYNEIKNSIFCPLANPDTENFNQLCKAIESTG